MVSGRCGAVFRQLLVIGLLFTAVTIFIFEEEKAILEELKRSLHDLQRLERYDRIVTKRADEIASEVNRTKQLVQVHLNQLEAIDQFAKKKNLILRGVVEQKEEDLEALEKSVVDIFQENLKIALAQSDIEFAQRIEGGDPRPILIRFVRLKDKSKAFSKRKNLPKLYTLEEDLTPAQRIHRKKLDDYAKRASQDGKNVKRMGGKLFVDGDEVDLKSIT